MEQPNWTGNILVFFKRGDQDVAFGGVRHNEPVAIIDPEEWVANHGSLPEFNDSNKDLVAYASLLIPRAHIQTIQGAIESNGASKLIEIGNPHKDESGKTVVDPKKTAGRVILDDSLPLFSTLKSNWDALGVSVPPVVVPEETVASLLKTVSGQDLGAPHIHDANAWTSGSRTFGSGGNYALRSTMYADIGVGTGDMFATQISDITDANCGLTFSSTYNLIEDGQNFTTIAGGTYRYISLFWATNIANLGIFEQKNLHLRVSASFASNYGVIDNYAEVGNHQLNGTWLFHHSKVSKQPGAVCDNALLSRTSGTGTGYHCAIKHYNVMLDKMAFTGEYIQAAIENCVVANITSSAYGAFAGYGYSVQLKNTILLNCAYVLGNFDGPPAVMNIAATNCATDNATLGTTSDVNSRVNIVATDEFLSTDILSPNAYKLILVGGNLIGRGTTPSLPENTTGFYGTPRPGRAGYYSIGPDEPQLDETLLGVGLTSNGVASLGNDGTFSSNVTVGGGGYNNGHLLLGSNHLWVDSTGNLRVKNSTPTYDSDGTVVGTQS